MAVQKLGGEIMVLAGAAVRPFLPYLVGVEQAREIFRNSKTDYESEDYLKALEFSATTLTTQIHDFNVEKGWWSNPETGEFIERNIGEMLMLMVSELSEAHEAHVAGVADDKLRHLSGFAVEMADVLIRLFDVAGRHCPVYGAEIVRATRCTDNFPAENRNFMQGVNYVSRAMEHARKGRPFDKEFAELTVWVLRMGAFARVDIPLATLEKFLYNATRPDHKLENRRAAGGKKF